MKKYYYRGFKIWKGLDKRWIGINDEDFPNLIIDSPTLSVAKFDIDIHYRKLIGHA